MTVWSWLLEMRNRTAALSCRLVTLVPAVPLHPPPPFPFAWELEFTIRMPIGLAGAALWIGWLFNRLAALIVATPSLRCRQSMVLVVVVLAVSSIRAEVTLVSMWG